MPVTREEVVLRLLPEEPDYHRAAAEIGPEALPFLEELIQGDDLELATKATSLAGNISDPRSTDILLQAARSDMPTVRVAAAFAARFLPATQASAILLQLLSDADIGVRKVAVTSIAADATADLRTGIESLASSEPDPALRELVVQLQQRLGL